MLAKIKDNLILILGGALAVVTLLFKYFYHKSLKLEVKVKHRDAQIISNKAKSDLDLAIKESEHATNSRKSIVDKLLNNPSQVMQRLVRNRSNRLQMPIQKILSSRI